MTRVCHFTSVHSALDVRIFEKECVSLARAGLRVSVLAPGTEDEAREGVSILRVPMPGGRARRLTLGQWRLARELLELDAAVYHFHDPELIPLGLFLRAKGKAVIYDAHEDVPRDVLSKTYLPAWLRGPVSRVAEGVENLAARWFSAIVAATPHIADRFRARNGRVVAVLNYPRRDGLRALTDRAWSQRNPAVAYVGGISEDRGLRQMLEAVAVASRDRPVTLALAGRFSPTSLGDAATSWPGWRNAEYHGWLDRDSVHRLLASVRAGLLILHPTPAFLDSYPIKLFEYMAAGLPVIASDFPLWRGIVGEARCGILVDPRDVSGIAEAVRRLVDDPEEAEAMGRRGRRLVDDRYHWEAEERKLLGLYAGLAD